MTNIPRIVAIVEGEGEQKALPILIQRISLGMDPPRYVDAYTTILTHRDTFPRVDHERERALRAAREDAGADGAILVLLDSDGEPPCGHGEAQCLLGRPLLNDIQRLAPDHSIAVVIAQQEYEAWFLAAAASLSMRGALRPGVDDHPDPESVPDAKGWLTNHMPIGRKYAPTRNQASFTAQFDLQAARRAESFDTCYREIERLVQAVTADSAEPD